MTRPDVKTATGFEENAVIDALKLAFVELIPATRWVWPDSQKYLLHFFKFAKAFGGKAFEHIRLPTILEIILVPHFGYHQILILMSIPYLDYSKKLHPKNLKTLFQKCLRKWVDIIQTNPTGICRFWEWILITMVKVLVRCS